ncbi:MAG TPA: hypothetical protein ENH11_05125 [Candidatus Acetothermia bacterium]|nr:hypothetical protein [Candidatus Acetothermia bacterium]
MFRKVVLVMATVVFAVVSVVLVGGQSDGGLLWWRAHEPIYIYGNDAFTSQNGVISGSGSANDPYVIEGWYIDVSSTDYGIYIDHTSAYFVIRGCVVEKARDAGIYLNSVTNGRIEKCRLSLGEAGVRLLNANGNIIESSVIAKNHYGVVMMLGSKDNKIYGNSFINNGISALDQRHLNTWTGSTGNYWSDYKGTDANGDGIGDQAYTSVYDPHPLMTPPVKWMRVTPMAAGLAGSPVSQAGAMVITSQMPITLTAKDPGSGVAKILYSINGEDWQEYTGPFTLSGPDGEYHVSYYGVDNLGNAEPPIKLEFVLDNNPPQTKITFGKPNYSNQAGQWLTSKTPITLNLVSASTYGITKTFYAIDSGAWRRYSGAFHVTGTDGPHQISYYSRNASGTTETVQTITVLKDDTPPMTRGSEGKAQQGVAPQSNVTPPTPSSPPTSVAPESQVQTEASAITPQPASSAAVSVAQTQSKSTMPQSAPATTKSTAPDTTSGPTNVQTQSTTD